MLRDSQSILVYLTRRYAGGTWFSTEPEPMARITQWLCVAANEIRNGPNPAPAIVYKRSFDVVAAQTIARHALRLMNAHLTGRHWLETNNPTIADIACYPYIAVAPQMKYRLSRAGSWRRR